MSWLDSSFSFAKTALSQAQKSIDRVLDIKEGAEGEQSGSARPSVATSKPASTTTNVDNSSSSEVDPSSTSSPFSSWFQPKQAGTESKPGATTPGALPVQQSSDSFSSTWGSGNSFWSSTFGSPSKKEQPQPPDAASSLKKPSPASTAPRGSGVRSTKSTSGGPVKKSTPTPSSAPRGERADSSTGTPRLQTDRRKKDSPPMKVESPLLTSTPVNAKEVKHASQKKGESRRQTAAEEPVSKEATGAKKQPSVGSRTARDVDKSQQLKGTVQHSGREAQSSNQSTPRSGNISPPQPLRGTPVAAVLEADEADTTDGGGRTLTSGTGGHTSPSPPHSTILSKETPGKREGEIPAPAAVARGLAVGGVLHSQEEPRERPQVEGALEYVTLAVAHSPDSTGRLSSPDSENVTAREDPTDEASAASDRTVEGNSRSALLPATTPSPDQASKATLEKEGAPETLEDGSEQSHEPRNDQVECVAVASPLSPKDSSPLPAPASENVTAAPTSPTPPPASISSTPPPTPISPPHLPGPTTPTPPPALISPTHPPAPVSPTPPPVPTSPTPSPAPTSPTPSPAPTSPTSPPVPTSPTPSPAPTSPTPPPAPIPPTHPPTTAQQSGILSGAQTRDSTGEGDRLLVEESAQNAVQAESLQQGGDRRKSGGQEDEADKEPSGSSRGAPAPVATGGDPVGSSAEESQRLREELQRVSKILEVRENKLLEMSRDGIQLREENQTLETQLRECRDLLQSEQTDVEELRSECTRRISASEKKLQTVLRERDSLRKQLQAVQNEQSQHKRSAEQELTELLREKEEQIAGLMKEGENLSKQQLQSHNTIKKMRAKDKQNDQLLAAQRQQIEDCELEMRRLKGVLEKKEENEKKYQESLAQLNHIAEQQDKELLTLKSERDDLMDKVRSLQTNLDNTFKELAEVRKASAVTQSEAQEAALSAEQMAREELMSVLERGKMEAQREKESLLMQINELRMSVSRTEQQAAWREEHMRQEVADIQQRLQDAEGRNQELTSSISQTTKPLLRQIDSLQVAHSTQAANWERVEGSLTQRLVEAQSQLNLAVEKERSASEKEVTLQSRVTALESQLAALRQERAQLLASLELERAKLETLEEGQQRDSAKMEALRTSYQQSLEDLKKEKEMLERQLEYERVRLEAESRKACLESQEKERLRSKLANSISSLSRTISRQSSSGSIRTQSEILEKSLVADGGSSGGFMEGISHSRLPLASASVIEHLQSQLKQKEGELANTQNLVSSLERSRAAMAEDLASLSAQNQTLTTQVETIPSIQQNLQEVQRNYEALLQMYGEKAELTEELKMDIADLKTMYKQQIEELLSGR